MEDQPRRQLAELIRKYGRGLVDDPRRTEALLRDMCGQHRREVSVLVGAHRERVPADLVGSKSNIPATLLIARLADRLDQNLGMARDAAQWAVESWALALGVVSPTEISPQSKPTQTASSTSSRRSTRSATPPTSSTARSSSRGTGKAATPSPSAFTTLTEAIRRASAGEVIIIPPGVYRESLNVDKQVTIRAGGARGQVIVESTGIPCLKVEARGSVTATGITFRHYPGPSDVQYDAIQVNGKLSLDDCDVESSTLTRHSAVINVDTEAEFRNSRIRNGFVGVRFSDGARGTVSDCEISGASNIGFVSINNSSPMVSRCRISGNAGLYVISSGGVFSDSEIVGTEDTGAVIMRAGSPIFRKCSVSSITAGAMHVRLGCRGTIEDCDLLCEEGFWSVQIGTTNEERAGVQASNPTFRQSRMNNGVIVIGQEEGTFESCDIKCENASCVQIEEASNPSLQGCTIHLGTFGVNARKKGRGSLEGCEVSENSNDGIYFDDESELNVRNCTIIRNKGVGVSATVSAHGLVENCDVRGNGGGAWNVGWLSGLKRKNNKDKGKLT